MRSATVNNRSPGAAILPMTIRRLSWGIAGLALCWFVAGALAQAPTPANAPPRTAARQRHPATTAHGAAELHGVSISRSNQGILVHVNAGGPLRVTSGRLAAPERIVVDLEGARFSGRTLRVPVHGGKVLAVRVSQFQSDPPMARIVLDVARPFPFEVVSYRHGFAIQVDTEDEAPAQKQGAPAVPPPPLQSFPAANNEDSVKSVPETANLASVNSSRPAGVTADSGTLQAAAVIAEPALPPLGIEQLHAPTSRLQAPELWVSIVPPAENLVSDEEGPTTAHQAAKANLPVSLSGVTISRQTGGIDVHIEANGPLRPTARVYSKPDRIVVDLANAYCDRARRIPVHAAELKNIDISLYLLNPPVTRIVLNLARPRSYQLLQSGSSLVIRVDTREPARTQAQPAAGSGSPVTLLREPATR